MQPGPLENANGLRTWAGQKPGRWVVRRWRRKTLKLWFLTQDVSWIEFNKGETYASYGPPHLNHKIICSFNYSLRPFLISPLLDELGNTDIQWAQALPGKTRPAHVNQQLNVYVQAEFVCNGIIPSNVRLKTINTWWLSYMIKTISTQTLYDKNQSTHKVEAKIMSIRVMYPFNRYFLSASEYQTLF